VDPLRTRCPVGTSRKPRRATPLKIAHSVHWPQLGAERDLAQLKMPIDTRIGTRYGMLVIKTFRHRGLRQLYEDGDASRVRADQVRRVTDVLAHLDLALKASDLDLPGYRLHPLRGDMRGRWSVTISGNWRIVFRFENGDAFDVDLMDYH
jgi:toxin HigB-1